MEFGINTWFFKESEVKTALRKIKESGFNTAEVWMEHILATGENPEEISEYAKVLEMKLTFHSTSYDINLTSINEGIRTESLNQARLAVEMSDQLGAEVLVIHPGRLSASRCSLSDYWSRLDEAFEKINSWARNYGVKVGVEAMEKKVNEVYTNPEHIKKMLMKEWSNIGLTLDIAHTFTVMNPEDYIAEINPEWIFHVHLSDGDRNHTHLPLGKGLIDINGVLKFLKNIYNGIVIIEGYVPSKGEETVQNNYNFLKINGWI